MLAPPAWWSVQPWREPRPLSHGRECGFAGLNALARGGGAKGDRCGTGETGLARFAWDADHLLLGRTGAGKKGGEHLRVAVKKRYGPGALQIRFCLARVRSTDRGDARAKPHRTGMVRGEPSAVDVPERNAHTSIVLADEGLLPALLEALPGDSGAVNVTMGVSLAALPVGALLDAFFRGLTRPVHAAPSCHQVGGACCAIRSCAIADRMTRWRRR